MKRYILVVLGVVCVALLVAAIQSPENVTIQVGAHRYTVDRATTHRARVQGLSGRTTLPEGTGMLFVFDSNDRHGIWMKEMRFAIDILWFDADGVVVDIRESVDPNTYPEVFRPSVPARYVLELPAGTVKEDGLVVGDQFIQEE